MSKRLRRGITLIEMLVAATLMVILLGALSYGFVAGLDRERQQSQRRAETNREELMETRLSEMIRGAKLTEDATDLTTYFLGEDTGNQNADLGCDRLTFTTTAPSVPLSAVASTDDFETQQQSHGPMGGIAEVAWSTTSSGDVPDDRTGLFERLQRPSDGDATQGGNEMVVGADIAEMGFQFWDGTQWMPHWNTTTGDRRLPTAVKVSYILKSGDAQESGFSGSSSQGGEIRSFVVPIPASDVDEQNPVSAQTTSGGPSTL